MSSKAQYVIKQINNVCLDDRYTVSKIILFRCYDLIKTNNGAYIHIKEIDEETEYSALALGPAKKEQDLSDADDNLDLKF